MDKESYPTLVEKEFHGKLQAWRRGESTPTSPSGLHLGHWKELIARHAHSEDEDENEEPTATADEAGSPRLLKSRDEWNHMQRE